MYDELKDHIQILLVYIREAHARDDWPLGRIVSVDQPKTLQERLNVVQNFIQTNNFQIPILIDDINDSFCKTLCAWPERYFIIENRQFTFIGNPSNEYGYDRLHLRRTLRNLIPHLSTSLLDSREDNFSVTSFKEQNLEEQLTTIADDLEDINKHLVVYSNVPYSYPTQSDLTDVCIPGHLLQNA